MRPAISCLLFTIALAGCKQEYVPPVQTSASGYLVVDGTIIAGNDSTLLTLTRSRPLADTSRTIYETGARVALLGPNGESFPFTEVPPGKYTAGALPLDAANSYQLQISTADGSEYLSDPVPVKTAPPIKSITWAQDSSGVRFFLDTEDPSGNTRYYRWDYLETWEYQAGEYSTLAYSNGVVSYRGLDSQVYTCYQQQYSPDINVATSEKLSGDVISHHQVGFVPLGSEKLGLEYSTLIRQYALTKEAYAFWDQLRATTQQLGALFDPQPFTAMGNLHCTSNPALTVLGYIGISTVREQRLFVSRYDVNNWGYQPYYGMCTVTELAPDKLSTIFPNPDPPFFYTLTGTNNGIYLYTTIECGDCRAHGGINVKPSFWP